MSHDEPDYLKAMKRDQQRRKSAAGGKGGASAADDPSASVAERETVRWAQEVAGKEPQVAPSLRGAKCAILFKPASISGRAPIVLEGVESRDALVARLKVAEANGQEVLGCYEVSANRPLTVETVEGKTSFKAGAPRTTVKPMSPAQMLRKATLEAEVLAKSRKFDDRGRERGVGGGGGGGAGRGGGGGAGRGGGPGRGGERGRGPGSGGGAGGAGAGGADRPK